MYSAELLGPYGTIRVHDIVYVIERPSFLELLYMESWGVLNGAYHCCLSIPGKVILVP